MLTLKALLSWLIHASLISHWGAGIFSSFSHGFMLPGMFEIAAQGQPNEKALICCTETRPKVLTAMTAELFIAHRLIFSWAGHLRLTSEPQNSPKQMRDKARTAPGPNLSRIWVWNPEYNLFVTCRKEVVPWIESYNSRVAFIFKLVNWLQLLLWG